MKKIAAIILGLVLLGAGAYFALFGGATNNEYARYLPQDAAVTLNLLHLSELSDTFAASALGQFLGKDTMHAVLSDMGGTARDLAEYDRMFDDVAGVMTNPAFRAVFGADAAVALLAPDPGVMRANPVQALRDSLVVVSRTTVAGALDLFSRMVKNANISRQDMDGLELTKVVIDPQQTLYGYTEGRMVFLAYNPEAIKRCLAAADKGGRQLDRTVGFARAADYWQAISREQTYFRLFVNPQELSRLLAAAGKPEFKQSAALFQGVDGLYSVAYAGEEGLESRARAAYRYDQLDPVVKSAVDAATSPNPTLSLLREQSLAYSWASALRPELLTRVLVANDPEDQRIDAGVRELLGVGLEELGRAFGPQYGGVLDDIVRAALFPVPRMTLFVSLRDRAVAQKMVDTLRAKIAENGMIKEEQEQVAGHTVYCWPLLPDKDAQPALAMTDTMLYLATSKGALREVLQSTATADSLAAPVATGLGASLAKRVGAANTGSLVLYPRRMSAKTGETLDWLAGILATTKNISLSRLNREVIRLMQSTEILALTSNMSREQAEWTLTLRRAQPQAQSNTAK
ncbi:MAG: DUF3352 domain-containing protein [Desulfobulbus sp.]